MDIEILKNNFDIKVNDINKNDLYYNTYSVSFFVEHKIKKINYIFQSMASIEDGKTINEIIDIIWLKVKDSVLNWADKVQNNNSIGIIYIPI